MRPWLRKLHEAHAQNPELAKLMVSQHRNEMAIHDWQSRYNAADPQERTELLQEGRTLAAAQVDLFLQRKQMQIQILEKRLHDLKASLQEQQANKDKIVDRELETISIRPSPHTTKPSP
jgi:hypothetical protein